MDLKSRIGRRIREVREAKGWTQQQLGESANLDPATLSRIESGRRNITLSTLADLMAGLGTSTRNFFAAPLFDDLPASGGLVLNSEHFRMQATKGALRVYFPCGKHDAQFDFRKLTGKEVEDAILLLRDGLSPAEMLEGTSASEEQRGLMSKAISDCFFHIVRHHAQLNPSDVWRYIVYRAFIDPQNHPSTSMRKDFGQSWRRTSGLALEKVVALHYGSFLKTHGLTVTDLRSNSERRLLLDMMGLADKVPADKADQFVVGDHAGRSIPFGVLHVKASLAERRTDDIPASRVIQDTGYVSVFVTMDSKDTPSRTPTNRGEYGKPGDAAREKRNDIEVHGSFSAVFSFNRNTVESPTRTPSGNRIRVVDFSNPDDQFSRYLRDRWRDFRRKL
jgi:transcriptional regulator with XRE-family HTH domain